MKRKGDIMEKKYLMLTVNDKNFNGELDTISKSIQTLIKCIFEELNGNADIIDLKTLKPFICEAIITLFKMNDAFFLREEDIDCEEYIRNNFDCQFVEEPIKNNYCNFYIELNRDNLYHRFTL